MPVADEVKSSWADEVEEEGSAGALPPPSEVFENGFKILTEYKLNEDGKKVKVVRTYKIERLIVSKTIAMRKAWKKFGQSASDKAGPNPATTVVAEDVYMQYISSKEEENKQNEDALDKLKGMGEKAVVKCRKCNGDHWTLKCPYKDTELVSGKIDKPSEAGGSGLGDKSKNPATEKYVPPSLRDGANKRGESMATRNRDDAFAIRVSNLSENTTEPDLEDLVKPFGPIQKIYLARDKITGVCKGFSYIHFKFKTDAAKAVAQLNGHGYDHLILNVDWSKPPAQST